MDDGTLQFIQLLAAKGKADEKQITRLFGGLNDRMILAIRRAREAGLVEKSGTNYTLTEKGVMQAGILLSERDDLNGAK